MDPAAPPRCLVIDDDESMRLLTIIRLEEAGGALQGVATADEAMALLDGGRVGYAMVVADRRLAGAVGGVQVLQAARASLPGASLALITAHVDAQVQAEAAAVGAMAVDKLDLEPLVRRWAGLVSSWRP